MDQPQHHEGSARRVSWCSTAVVNKARRPQMSDEHSVRHSTQPANFNRMRSVLGAVSQTNNRYDRIASSYRRQQKSSQTNNVQPNIAKSGYDIPRSPQPQRGRGVDRRTKWNTPETFRPTQFDSATAPKNLSSHPVTPQARRHREPSASSATYFISAPSYPIKRSQQPTNRVPTGRKSRTTLVRCRPFVHLRSNALTVLVHQNRSVASLIERRSVAGTRCVCANFSSPH
jgi:hypothetical protein